MKNQDKKKNMERQRQYRFRLKAGGGKWLSVGLSAEANIKLSELATRYGVSRRETVERIISHVFDCMEEE